MAGPNNTFAETWTQFGKVVKIVNELEKFGSSNAANYLDMEDALTTVLDGRYTPLSLTTLRQFVRTPIAQALSPGKLRELFWPFLLELAYVINAPELKEQGSITLAQALRRLRQYMEDNTQTLNSRGMTIDTSTSGSPTGTGAIHRLTVDKDNNTLECIGPDSKAFVCEQDQTSGARKHAEVFEYRPARRDVDALQWQGSGSVQRITSLNCKSANLLRNPSFEEGALTDNTALASTTQLTGWTATTAASWKTRSAAGYTYRGYPGEPSTLWSLENTASDTIAQVLRTASPGAAFDPRVPYLCQVAWQRKASATGTLTLHCGTQTAAATIGSATNDQWNVLKIAIGTGNWFDNFKENDLDVKLVTASLATGTILVDDVVLAPMSLIDGNWVAVVGADTAWIRGDTLSFTGDADGTRALFSYWLWRMLEDQPQILIDMYGWFPTDNATTETIADPA